MSNSGDLLSSLSVSVERHRAGGDPSAPVVLLCGDDSTARVLGDSVARAGRPGLSLGITVLSGGRVAREVCVATARAGDPRPGTDSEIRRAVRHAAAGSEVFADLAGRSGVNRALLDAVLVWDNAGPENRESLLDRARRDGDSERLDAVSALHADVVQGLAAIGAVLPSGMFAMAASRLAEFLAVDDRHWIDVTPVPVLGAAGAWHQGLVTATGAHRVEVATAVPSRHLVDGDLQGFSAIDPLQESELVARRISLALEQGTAPRDIVVGLPMQESARYSDEISRRLHAAGIPCDATDASLWRTPQGRLVTRLNEVLAEVASPAQLRVDHLVDVVLDAGSLGGGGERLNPQEVRDAGRSLLGTRPQSWPDRLRDVEGPAGPVLADTAAALIALASAGVLPLTWGEMGTVLDGLLSRVPVTSSASAAAQSALSSLVATWSQDPSRCTWPVAMEDLSSTLDYRPPGNRGGVRLLPLTDVWAAMPGLALMCGVSDDLVPGSPDVSGPLSAQERLWLTGRADAVVLPEVAAVTSALAMAQCAEFSYSRSDLLANVVRMPSRALQDLRTHDGARVHLLARPVGSLADGSTGLLGAADAARIVLSGPGSTVADVADLVPVDLARVLECLQARRHPPAVGDVDVFCGDLTAIAAADPGRLDPDYLTEDPPRSSPSSLERLVQCPLGWWSERVLRIREPEAIDPAQMNAAANGTWLHEALKLLLERGQLDAGVPQPRHVTDALWDALGGPPDLDEPRPVPDGLACYRLRVDPAQMRRAVSDVTLMARALAGLLDRLGGSQGRAAEVALGPTPLALDGTPDVWLAGRADRIDQLHAGFLISDYKTGQAGDGLQLAAYAWLNLQAGASGPAHVAYVQPSPRPASPLAVSARGSGVVAEELAVYLSERLSAAIAGIRAGHAPPLAGADEHNRYCPICGDLVAGAGWNTVTSERSRALLSREVGAGNE